MEIVSLLQLSQAEIRGRKPSFLRAAFAGKISNPAEALIGESLVQAVLMGGYPEMLRRKDSKRRRQWALGYVRALVQRDVREIAELEKLDHMPRLLRVLAHHSGRLTNVKQTGREIGLDDKTTGKYIGILEQLFLIRRVEPWFRNRLKRLVKTPKLYFLDSGLLSVLSEATADRIARDRAIFGALLETFVFAELLKQTSWSDEGYALHHYRDKDQDEVDLVIEAGNGELIGIEVKAGATVRAEDFRGLHKLASASGDDFKLGVVLYDGEKSLRFGDHFLAAPISCLWG
jgi:predicted AAA+ superfamily ATPase